MANLALEEKKMCLNLGNHKYGNHICLEKCENLFVKVNRLSLIYPSMLHWICGCKTITDASTPSILNKLNLVEITYVLYVACPAYPIW